MVEIELGPFRLLSTRLGLYEIHVLGTRGSEARNPGETYVKTRITTQGLDNALQKLLHLWPQRPGVEIKSLVELRRDLEGLEKALAEALGLSLPPRKCLVCARFMKAAMGEVCSSCGVGREEVQANA